MTLASLRKLFSDTRRVAKLHPSMARPKFPLVVERLEDRIALATHPVNTFADLQFWATNSMEGDTINVAPGDYRLGGVVSVTVKRLEINGARHFSNPTYPGRTPAGPNESTVAGFDLLADKIQIDGFTINNALGSGISTAPDHSGYDIEDNIFSGNLIAGILVRSNGVYRTEIETNWFNNLASALGPDGWNIRNFGDGPLSNVEIEKNKFSDPSMFGSAIDLEGTPTAPFSRIKIDSNRFEHSNGIILWNAIESQITDNKLTNYINTGISLRFQLDKVYVVCNDIYAGAESGDGIRIEEASGVIPIAPLIAPASFIAQPPPPRPNVVVEHNFISGGNGNTPGGFGADGIDVLNTALGFVVRIGHNKITHMGHDGIRIRDGASGAIVHNNHLSFCLLEGIDIEGANGNFVIENTSHNNGNSGIRIASAMNNVVKCNNTYRNAYGILVTSTSSGNTFERNKSFGNTIFDYRDASDGSGTAGTANTWTNNVGGTASPEGLKTTMWVGWWRCGC